MDPLQLAPLTLLETSLEGFYRTRYLTVAGLVVLLWDHCLTFERERRYIWPARNNVGKWGFLCCRYVVPIILIVEAHTNSGLNSMKFSDNFCRTWVVVTCLSGVIFSAFSRALVLMRLWRPWNGLGSVILATSVVFVIAEVGSVASMAISIQQSWSTYHFVPSLHICAVTSKPGALKGVWGFTVFLELFMFVMVYVNALSRPRSAHTFMLGVLYRDGIVFFLTISTLGWLNLVVAITAPASEVFLGAYCIWALVTTIVSRMIINLQEAEKRVSGEIHAVNAYSNLA